MMKKIKPLLVLFFFTLIILMFAIPQYKRYVLTTQWEYEIKQAVSYALEQYRNYEGSKDDDCLELIACELHLCERILEEMGKDKEMLNVNAAKNALIARGGDAVELHYLEKGLEAVKNDVSSSVGYSMFLSFYNMNTQ